jgi:hypothetical protein
LSRLLGVARAAIWACALSAPAPAAAQRIDQYLIPDIRGTDEQAGVTVESRLRPAYDYPGIHIGSFILRPELVETAGYDDNVLSQPSPRGSSFEETQATVSLASLWVDDRLQATVTVDDSEYFDLPRQSYTNWTATLAGSHEIGRDVLSATYSHLNENQTPSGLGVPQLDAPAVFRIDDGRVSYSALFNRLTVQPGLALTSYSFDNGTELGVPFIQTYRDRVVVTPSVNAEYEYAPLRTAVLFASDSIASYSNQVAGQPSRDYNDFSVLGGVNYDTGGKVRLRLLAGYEVRTFSSMQYPTISAPIVEASAVWTPTGLTTVTATASRYIEDSSSETTTGYTETALKLVVDHELLRNVLLRATARYTTDEYDAGGNVAGVSQGGGGSQSFYSIRLAATWLINRHLRLAAGYQFAHRSSGSGAVINDEVAGLGVQSVTGVFGSSYNDNRAFVTLRFGL